nr:helix-turn-helix domain-containing protein [Microbacterium testaceum]
MLVNDLIDAIENYLELSPEECKETTSSLKRYKKKSYTLPGMAKPLKREARESQQAFAYRKFFSYLISHGLHLMGQEKVSTLQELNEALTAYIPKAVEKSNLKVVDGYEIATGRDSKKSGYTRVNLVRSAERASRKAFDDFDAETYKGMQERGAAAGRKTKHSVDQFLETRHMTVTEAARYLGFSRPTVYAMRSYYGNVNLETGEVDE